MKPTAAQLETKARKNLKTAQDAGRWLSITVYVGRNGQLMHERVTNDFPQSEIEPALSYIAMDLLKLNGKKPTDTMKQEGQQSEFKGPCSTQEGQGSTSNTPARLDQD